MPNPQTPLGHPDHHRLNMLVTDFYHMLIAHVVTGEERQQEILDDTLRKLVDLDSLHHVADTEARRYLDAMGADADPEAVRSALKTVFIVGFVVGAGMAPWQRLYQEVADRNRRAQATPFDQDQPGV